MTWRERLRPARLFGYGLKGEDRRRSFFWLVIFVGLFPAIWFGYLLRAIARLLITNARRMVHAWPEVQPRRLRGTPRSLRQWARPARAPDVSAQHQQIVLAGGWLFLAVAAAVLPFLAPAVGPGGAVALTVFAVACGTRVVAHVVTWRWLRVSSSLPWGRAP